jgi:hypothetical protein
MWEFKIKKKNNIKSSQKWLEWNKAIRFPHLVWAKGRGEAHKNQAK